jgi:hypothetical protein
VGGGADGEEKTRVKTYGFGYSWTFRPNFFLDGNAGLVDLGQTVANADISKGDYGQDSLGIPGTNNTNDSSCLIGAPIVAQVSPPSLWRATTDLGR